MIAAMLKKISKSVQGGNLFLSLAPVAGGFGLWLIFQGNFSIVFDYHTCKPSA